MKTNICHVGFPKTGTTYLQQYIFNQIIGLQFIYNKTVFNLFNQIINDDETILEVESIRSQFDKLFKNSSINFCSFEPLIGENHQGGFISRSIIAKRLKSFGFHKIMICIRNQYDIIDSTYGQYIKIGGILKFNEYFDFLQDRKKPNFKMDYFNYYLCCKLYASIFGRENILIIQYEQINTISYFESIFNFIGLPFQNINTKFSANRSISKKKTNLLRIINHFTYNSFRPNHLISKKISTYNFHRLIQRLPFLNEKRSYTTDKHYEIIKDLYKDSNIMLEKDFGLILNKKYPK